MWKLNLAETKLCTDLQITQGNKSNCCKVEKHLNRGLISFQIEQRTITEGTCLKIIMGERI